MAINVFKKISDCKVAPLIVHDDLNGLGSQKCPEDLFRARRGFEQCKLNFLTTIVDIRDGQSFPSGLFYEPTGYPVKTTSTDLDRAISAQNILKLDRKLRNYDASIKQKGKPRKFRPRKILRKLVGKKFVPQSSTILTVFKNKNLATSGVKERLYVVGREVWMLF